jgi:hypothetical protein
VGAPQDTPARMLGAAPVALGVARTAQPPLPENSASVRWVPEPSRKYPTAVQAAEPHDTPARELAKRLGSGMLTIDHAVPFQASPSVAVVLLPPAEEDPTAVHEAADRHDTPTRRSRPSEVPAGLGVGWMDHVVPFHASTSVAASGAPELPGPARPGPPRPRGTPERRAPWMEAPTAVHAAAALHETPYRRLTMAPDGLGTVRTFQVLPSHSCASVTMSSELALSSFPTAMQAATAVQETPARKP